MLVDINKNALESTKNFDYSIVNNETAEFLQQKAINIEGLYHKARFDIGKELKAAQDQLAKHRYGCFGDWVESIGMQRQRAYELIDYHDLIVRNSDKRDLIEGLPKTLAMAISKKSAPIEAAQAVLNGDITTHKEYQQLLKAQKEAEAHAEAERKAREQAEESSSKLASEKAALEKQLAQKLEPIIVEKTVKVMPVDYESLKSDNRQYKETVSRVIAEKEKLAKDLEVEREAIKASNKADGSSYDVRKEFEARAGMISGRVELFIKDMAAFGYMGADYFSCSDYSRKRYEKSIERLEKLTRDLREQMSKLATEGDKKIIDVEAIDL